MYTIKVVFFFDKKTSGMHAQQCILYCTYCTILFITGYCSIHVYSQTHLHDLLLAHYTGNRQSTVYIIQRSICKVWQQSMCCNSCTYEEGANGVSVYQLQTYNGVQYFVSRFPTHKVLRHNAYTQVSTTYTQTFIRIRRQQRSQPGRALAELYLTEPVRTGADRAERFLNSLAIRAGSSIL